MFSTVEISHSAIRIVQCNKENVEEVDEFPVEAGADPITTLGTVSITGSLGAVRVVIHHEDILLGSMVQAPCPPDRMARMIEFEMKTNIGDQVDQSLLSWHVSHTGGTGDMRILTAVTKKDLIERIQEALKVNKGRMVSLVPPALGLYENWRAQGNDSDCLLVDIGGNYTHIAIAEKGELLFMRSISMGMDALVKDISELRSIDNNAARELVGKLNKNTPDDIKEIIIREAAALTQQINNAMRFAQSQLKIPKINYDTVVISGAGGRAPFFIDACGKHLNAQTVVFNPFPRLAASLPPSQMDKLAELPSPWGPALGAAQAQDVKLDGMHQVHRETKEYRQTSGILRLAAIIAFVLIAWSFINQNIVNSKTNTSLQELKGTGDGLVPDAQQKIAQINSIKQEHKLTLDKAQFLDGERRPGRISHELIAAITQIQDLEQCPISIQSMTVERAGNGLVVVELFGRAQSVGRLDTATVISRFEEGLKSKLPFFKQPMSPIRADTGNTPAGYHAFAYRLEFPDKL